MKKSTFLVFYLYLCVFTAEAQISGYKRSVNEGNRLYNEQKFEESYKKYQEAVARRKGINAEAAEYNAANSKYKLNDFQEAENNYRKIISSTKDKLLKAKAYHNLGNVFYRKNDYKNAIEAYKQSLLINPNDEETRYNLARALTMLQNQSSSGEGGNKNDNNINNNQKSNENEENQSEQKQNPKNENNEKSIIDETIAENLLQYLNQKDQQVQAKVKDKENKKKRIRQNEKDW